MELRRLGGFIAMMPFGKVGNLDWDWLGASLAKTIGEKLIFAELVIVPYYELKHLGQQVGSEVFMDWEELVRISEFLEGGHIITGSYILDDKQFVISVYVVHESGITLLAREEDTRENFIPVVGRVSQKVIATFGGPTDVETRNQLEAIAATKSLDAYQAMAAALEAWAAGNLQTVQEATERALALDPSFLDPLDILVSATRELDNVQHLRVAQKRLLTQLMSSSPSFKALVLLDKTLAYARQSGNKDLEADCLKTRKALESGGVNNLGQLYCKRATKVEEELETLLAEKERGRWRTLRNRGWDTGQVVALYLTAQSWFRQAETNLEVGYSTTARCYALRAGSLFAVLGSPQRQQAKKLLNKIEAALKAG